mmetsp:Transcript_55795/g.148786  ORF Transcript_55795/g.148786 Transcript_55795/m.148786 type:complete len:200 (+) Transcript_55795:533-1132(+)
MSLTALGPRRLRRRACLHGALRSRKPARGDLSRCAGRVNTLLSLALVVRFCVHVDSTKWTKHTVHCRSARASDPCQMRQSLGTNLNTWQCGLLIDETMHVGCSNQDTQQRWGEKLLVRQVLVRMQCAQLRCDFLLELLEYLSHCHEVHLNVLEQVVQATVQSSVLVHQLMSFLLRRSEGSKGLQPSHEALVLHWTRQHI